MVEFKILGKLNFKPILFFGVLEVLSLILFCYILAVTLQHLDPWLPTISECGELSPEKYFFRWGIMIGGVLLVLEAVFLHNAKRLSDLAFVLGFVAGLCLTGVACVASNENRTFHLIFALGFFALEDLMVLLMLFDNYQSLSYKSLALKIPSAGLAVATTVARFLIVFGVIRYTGDIPIVAIVEWLNAFALLAYHMTLSDDLDDLYLAQLEEVRGGRRGSKDSPDTLLPQNSKTPL